MTPREQLTPREIQIASLVWEGRTNREISRIVGTTEQVIKNHLRNVFDKLGVWSRLELAMYVAAMVGRHGSNHTRKPSLSPRQLVPSRPRFARLPGGSQGARQDQSLG